MPAPMPVSAPMPRRRPVRLTRRGRVVVGALLLLAVLGILALLAPPTEAARPTGPPRAVTVHEGDTLFSIASRAVPGASPYAVMAAIQQLNHMSDTGVFVGEQLLLPPS
jgi:Tfp pilus assembly protein FimV